MLKESKEKETRRKFIEHTIGTRKYFSYRADLIFLKFIISVASFLTIFLMSRNFIFSLVISSEAFLIFTLINKLNLDRKVKEGEELFIKESKKDYYNSKLNDMSIEKFQLLIKYFFEKEGYTDYKKMGNHLFTAQKNGETYCIKTFKIYNGIEIEKIDIRSYIVFLAQSPYKKAFFVTYNEMSEEANDLIKKANEEMDITVINNDKLFEFAEKNDLMPDKSYFYEKINDVKTKSIDKTAIKNTAFDKKKIWIYMLSAILFYVISIVLPDNMTSVYISWYFIILTVVCLLSLMASKVAQKSE